MKSLTLVFVLALFCVFLSLDAAEDNALALPTHGSQSESTSMEHDSENSLSSNDESECKLSDQITVNMIVDYENQVHEFPLDMTAHSIVDDLYEVVQAQLFSISFIEPEKQIVEPELLPMLQLLMNTKNMMEIQKIAPSVVPFPSLRVRLFCDDDYALFQSLGPTPCTRVYMGKRACSQPSVLLGDTRVCVVCASFCHGIPPGAVPSGPSTPFVCGCGVDANGEVPSLCQYAGRISPPSEVFAEPYLSKFAAYLHQLKLKSGMEKMKQKLLSLITFDFEKFDSQELARAKIPLADLQENALNAAKLDGREAFTQDDLLKALLHWFKNKFFRWVNEPSCQSCGSSTKFVQVDAPNEEEQKFHAGVAELYACNSQSCRTVTRFPRYNHPGKLMETQRGRCGEWAQAFTLCCRALGFQARHVIDWSDHVFTEVYSDTLKQFIHCDPCENSFNNPTMYEKGWKKKLSYIIACSAHEIRDVSRRYTKDYETVLSRRTQCPEQWLELLLHQINVAIISCSKLPVSDTRHVNERWQQELQSLRDSSSSSSGANPPVGRQSGSSAWRLERGELGEQSNKDKESTSASEVSSEP